MYKRISLKLSGEALGYDESTSLDKRIGAVDFDKVEATAASVAALHAMGVEVGVTLGGGNIWRGRSSGSMDRSRADQMGMLATIINSIALQDALLQKGVPCMVMTMLSAPRAADDYTSRGAQAALAAGKVVIFAGGSGNPFFSTDTAAALKACEIGADALLLAKNIDHVYTADPKTDPSARPIAHATYQDVIEKELKATDLTAITLCKENRVVIRAFGLSDPENLLRAARGEDVGTLIDGEGAFRLV